MRAECRIISRYARLRAFDASVLFLALRRREAAGIVAGVLAWLPTS